MTQQSILVVDDETDFITGFRRVLGREDLAIHSANTGEEGIAFLRQHRPDVIFMDLRMPGMDGLASLKRMRGIDPRQTSWTVTATPPLTVSAFKPSAPIAPTESSMPPLVVDAFTLPVRFSPLTPPLVVVATTSFEMPTSRTPPLVVWAATFRPAGTLM